MDNLDHATLKALTDIRDSAPLSPNEANAAGWKFLQDLTKLSDESTYRIVYHGSQAAGHTTVTDRLGSVRIDRDFPPESREQGIVNYVVCLMDPTGAAKVAPIHNVSLQYKPSSGLGTTGSLRNDIHITVAFLEAVVTFLKRSHQ